MNLVHWDPFAEMQSLFAPMMSRNWGLLPRLTDEGFAVGTALASSPPHSSVLAALPHTAPTSDDVGTALLGPRMKNAGSG